MTKVPQNLSFNIAIYFSFSKTGRDLFRYLLHMERLKKENGWPDIFPKINKMAKNANCSRRTVQRFNKKLRDLGNLVAEVISTTKAGGYQSTNIYRFSKDFLDCLIWLDRKNLLYADKSRYVSIRLEAENFENKWIRKMSPPPIPKCHPISLTLSLTQDKEYSSPEFIHPKIELVNQLSRDEKIKLSKYPEFAIVKGIEDAVFYRYELGKRIDNPYKFLLAQIGRAAGTRPLRH